MSSFAVTAERLIMHPHPDPAVDRIELAQVVFIKGNHEDFEWLDAQQAPEVLPGLTHDARRVGFEGHRPGAGYVSAAAGLDSLLAGARPGVCFFGHHHTRLDADVAASAASGSTRWRAPATWWRSASSPGDASGW